MSQPFRTCRRCGYSAVKWRGVWCKDCEEATKDATLYVLCYEDRSAIAYLFENLTDAQAVLKDDASNGIYTLILRKVTGQAGARSELNDSRSPFDQMWDNTEAALDREEFERTTS